MNDPKEIEELGREFLAKGEAETAEEALRKTEDADDKARKEPGGSESAGDGSADQDQDEPQGAAPAGKDPEEYPEWEAFRHSDGPQ